MAIRVLVVDDSLTTRKYLIETLAADADFQIVGEAEDGKQAIELCQRLRPDVMTLDMMLPLLSGVAVTEYVMAYCPTPILVVSASTNRGELFKTYDALAAGAVDVLDKPSGDDGDASWQRRLCEAVKVVSRIAVITHLRARSAARAPLRPPRSFQPARQLVAIGGSTGGPAAIAEILRAIPADFSLPILLVIHIVDPFGAAFADWLDGLSALRVRYAKDGEALPAAGTRGVIMAPPGLHLAVEQGRLRLKKTPERHSCRPSVDVLFESLVHEHAPRTIAVLLSGMGKDGAAGLHALRQGGALTLAQDEKSCVVFGMPKEAIALGGVTQVLPLDRIAGAIASAAEDHA